MHSKELILIKENKWISYVLYKTCFFYHDQSFNFQIYLFLYYYYKLHIVSNLESNQSRVCDIMKFVEAKHARS